MGVLMFWVLGCGVLVTAPYLIMYGSRRRGGKQADRTRRMNQLRAWRRRKVYVGPDHVETRHIPWRP